MCEINQAERQFGEIVPPMKKEKKTVYRSCCHVELKEVWRIKKLMYCPNCKTVYYIEE